MTPYYLITVRKIDAADFKALDTADDLLAEGLRDAGVKSALLAYQHGSDLPSLLAATERDADVKREMRA